MFWLSRSSASFFQKHINPHISLLRRLQFKSRRAVSAHTRRDALFTLSLTQKLYTSPRHTPDFCRNTLTCSAILRRAISDAGFSNRVFRHPSRFPRPIFHHRRPISPAGSKKLRSIPNKISKLRVRAANKQKRLLLPSMPISLSKHIGTAKSAGAELLAPQSKRFSDDVARAERRQ